MALLAIRGHYERGKEVIQLLEMLGGKNKYNLRGDTNDWFVLNGAQIQRSSVIFSEKGFTLEDFEEKFPYKVGDRVRVAEYESKVRISNIYWDGWEVQYEVVTDEVEWYSAKELNEFNEPNKEAMEEKKILSQIDLTKEMNVNDEIEVILGDYEFILKDGKTYFVKKQPQYPKDYEECCDVLNIETNRIIEYDECLGYRDITQYDTNLLTQLKYFSRLRICRDAYWKIAGEQMGLNKPWEPDYTDDNVKYIIGVHRNHLDLNSTIERNYILIFPTEEMRDAFYENFKGLIEQCKELL